MKQMQQQGKDVSKMLKKDGPPIYLAVNRQTNSVLANAPPEYMRTIEKAIKALDVPASVRQRCAPGERRFSGRRRTAAGKVSIGDRWTPASFSCRSKKSATSIRGLNCRPTRSPRRCSPGPPRPTTKKSPR